MLKSFRTYRFFPALVAALLFMGTGLPLVGYACGVAPSAGATVIVTGAEASSPDGCEDSVGCQDGSTDGPVDESSVASVLATSDAGQQCCTLRAQERVFVLVAPSISAAPSLPSIATSLVATPLPTVPFYLSSFSDRRSEAISSAPVSVRLVTSVFLL